MEELKKITSNHFNKMKIGSHEVTTLCMNDKLNESNSRDDSKSDSTDIIFMTHRTLIDPQIRHANNFDLVGSIVIIDEAHKLAEACEQSDSASIDETEIDAALNDINYVIQFEFL